MQDSDRMELGVGRMRPMLDCLTALSIPLVGTLVAFRAADTWSFLGTPLRGLDDLAHSQVIFACARLIGLSSDHLLGLGAFIGAVNLMVAALLVVSLLERLRPDPLARDHGTLDAGLTIACAWAVLVAVVGVAGGICLRDHAMELLLVAALVALRVAGRHAISVPDAAPRPTAGKPVPGLPNDRLPYQPW